MDNRGYGSGYSSWGGGGSGSRGSGGFDMYGGGFKDSMQGLGGYGGGGGGHIKRGPPGQSLLSPSGPHADDVIAKINQRLDMLTQLEGGLKRVRSDRFDQYESFDSRSSALSSSRDLYRSGDGSYGFGDDRGDNMLLGQRGGSGFGGGMGFGGGGGFDSLSSSYGVAKMRQVMREPFNNAPGGGSGGGGWAGAGRHSPRRGGGAGGRGGFGRRRPDPAPLGGVMRGGHSPGGGRGKLPSLLSNRIYPESGGFQGPPPGPHDFPGRHFGGGPRAGRQRGRKRPLNKQMKPQRDNQKKRKQTLSESDEPESKINKTEFVDSEPAQGTSQEPKEQNGEENQPKTEPVEIKIEEDEVKDAPQQEEKKKSQTPVKQPPFQFQDRHPKMKKRRGFLERVMFACSVCKFRSFYKEEMETHLESRFHKEHFRFLTSQLSKPTTDFLQEYLLNKFKKTDQRVNQLENHSAAICQVYKEQDLTKDIGMEHFMKKVEAAHCGACDLFIPMQPHLIHKHLKSADHNYNRKGMMEMSKRGSLSVARSILNHKLIGKKLESYLKGENPFVWNQDDPDQEDSTVMDVSELEMAAETADGQIEGAPATEEVEPEEETGQESEEQGEGEGEGGVKEKTAAADTVAEDTVAEDTVAEDTVAEDTVAEDTVAEDTVAEDTVAEDTVAEDTVAEDTVAEDTVAEDTVAEDTVAEDEMEEGEKHEEDPEPEHLEDEEGFEVGEDDDGLLFHDEAEQEGLPVELEEEGDEVREEEENPE